jgi:hypothetical protein
MHVPVSIEPTAHGGFRAQSLPPFTAVAEGKTSEEAISKVRAELSKEIEAGKRIVMVEVGTKEDNPWLKMAGWRKDDPQFDEWRAEVEAYRRQCDIEAGIEYDERP